MIKLTALRGIALVGTALTAACCCGPADAAPTGQSTAIAVDGDYIYVVENGSVYKLSSKDLKPVASARLAPSKPPAAAKTRVSRRAWNKRRMRSPQRRTSTKGRTPQGQMSKARTTTWRRMPVAAKTAEAGLPE